MHIKNQWGIIILIWSIICMTKAMLIYLWYIYTHIDVWIIYMERSSQNTEPRYDRMSCDGHDVSFLHIFCFQTPEAKRFDMTSSCLRLLPVFFLRLLPIFNTDIFGPFWSLILPLELRRSHSLLVPPPLLPSSPRWKQVLLLGFELMGRVMFGRSIRFIRVLVALGGSAAAFFVTTNPRSPTAWSADVSSRAGRGGSRSTSQSSLCLDGKWESSITEAESLHLRSIHSLYRHIDIWI